MKFRPLIPRNCAHPGDFTATRILKSGVSIMSGKTLLVLTCDICGRLQNLDLIIASGMGLLVRSWLLFDGRCLPTINIKLLFLHISYLI